MSTQDPTRRRLDVGYLEALAAAALWGSSGVFSVALFRRGVPPLSVAVLRPAIGAAFLLLAAWALRRAAFRVGWRAVAWMALVGGTATALFQVAYQYSTEAVGVPTTVALLYLGPAVVMAASGPLLGEWPRRRQVGLAALSVVGVWLTVTGARGADFAITPAGVAWGVAAAFAFASYTLFGRYAAPRWGSIATVLHSTWAAALALAVLAPLARDPIPLPTDAGSWGLLAAYGLLTIAVAAFLFYDGLRRIPATRVTIVATAEPVVAALLAALLVGQGLTPVGWLGLVLVVSGVAGAAAVRDEPT